MYQDSLHTGAPPHTSVFFFLHCPLKDLSLIWPNGPIFFLVWSPLVQVYFVDLAGHKHKQLMVLFYLEGKSHFSRV